MIMYRDRARRRTKILVANILKVVVYTRYKVQVNNTNSFTSLFLNQFVQLSLVSQPSNLQ